MSFAPPLPQEAVPVPKMVTVEDASPSPPPLPSEPLPEVVDKVDGTGDNESSKLGKAKEQVDHEHETNGDGKEELEDEEEIWDPSAESSIKETRKAVLEKPTAAQKQSSSTDPTNGWQAVWAPAQNGE